LKLHLPPHVGKPAKQFPYFPRCSSKLTSSIAATANPSWMNTWVTRESRRERPPPEVWRKVMIRDEKPTNVVETAARA